MTRSDQFLYVSLDPFPPPPKIYLASRFLSVVNLKLFALSHRVDLIRRKGVQCKCIYYFHAIDFN